MSAGVPSLKSPGDSIHLAWLANSVNIILTKIHGRRCANRVQIAVNTGQDKASLIGST